MMLIGDKNITEDWPVPILLVVKIVIYDKFIRMVR